MNGRADPVERIDDLMGGVGPADAQRRQTVHLGEGAGDQDVVGGAGQLQPILEIGVAGGELHIGAVDDQQDVFAQARVQALVSSALVM